MSKAAKKPVARKKNGYFMPKKLPVGTILQDTSKVQWVSGPSIGVGGFGEIYCACKASAKPKNTKDYEYVVKIEPHGNGPLFVEMHFYMRNAKLEDIEAFKKSHKLKHLGMPNFIGSGSHELEGDKHRFVVMPRYGSDIWSLFLKNGRQFPQSTVLRLGLQMLDVLEYIHGSTYVHADLKGANMLLGFGKGGDSQVFLVDFGLASHYTTNQEYKPDPKKMHNGTIEYTSRDAHNGVPTMRGDLEILAFNMIHWCGGGLPWEKDLKDPVKVQRGKDNAMDDIQKFIKSCFTKIEAPKEIVNFVKYVGTLTFNQKPDYEKCRKMFHAGLKTLGAKDSGPLEFGSAAPKKPKRSVHVISDSDEGDSPVVVPPKKSRGGKKPETDKNGSDTPIKLSKTISVETPSKKGGKNVISFNIDLDVAVDADLVVNVKRKVKNNDEDDSFVVETTKKKKKTEREETEKATKKTPPENKAPKKTPSPKAGPSRREKLNIPKTVPRAGEYKGKKAKE